MTLVIIPIDVGAAEGDGTGDKARVGGIAINDSFTNTKAAVESLQGRFWTVDNSARTLALGECIISGSHAGITHTLTANFAASATALSEIRVWNADSNSDVTLDPDGTDEIFLTGIGQGAGVSIALSPGQIAICFPRVTNASWDVIVITDWSSGQATAPITTTGALTCGALTSTGFDDNAPGERFQLADTLSSWGVAGTSTYTMGRVGNTGVFELVGGNAAAIGGGLRLYSGAHASQANDVEIYGGATLQALYDDSASKWDFRNNALITGGNLALDGSTPTVLLSNNTAPSVDFDRPSGASWRIRNDAGIFRIFSGTAGIANATNVRYRIDITSGAALHRWSDETGTTQMEMKQGTLKLLEISAAVADAAGMGQLWVKNATPNQLWFTDDAGTDTQIV